MFPCGICHQLIDPSTLASSSTGVFHCPHCGAPGMLPATGGSSPQPHADDDAPRKRRLVLLDEDIEEEPPGGVGEGVGPSPMLSLSLSADAYDSPSDASAPKRKRDTVPVQLGETGNVIGLQRQRFRFAFWNLENFTGDPIYRGNMVLQSDILSARNQVRARSVAEIAARLRLDALALMELGSDGARVMQNIVGELAIADPDSNWEFTISELTGPEIAPPVFLEYNCHAFKALMDQVRSLEALLPYYEVQDASCPGAYVSRHLWAQGILLRRADRPYSPEIAHLLSQLEEQRTKDEGDQANERPDFDIPDDSQSSSDEQPEDEAGPLSHVDIYNALCDLIQSPEYNDHVWLAQAFASEDRKRVEMLARALNARQFYVVALLLVFTGAGVSLEKNERPIETEGPLHALRRLGFNTKRYERYGLLFRTGLHEQYLLNEIVKTELMKEGEPTNSRAAVRFNLPFGGGRYLGAMMIHSMYTAPAPFSNQARALRLRTLERQAEYAASLPQNEQPMFIMGDTNIEARDIEEANRLMAACGYDRLGGAVPTTLRSTGTLNSAVTSADDIDSQPYDAVYQHRSVSSRFLTRVLHPRLDGRIILETALRMVRRDANARTWYFGVLLNRYKLLYEAWIRRGGKGAPNPIGGQDRQPNERDAAYKQRRCDNKAREEAADTLDGDKEILGGLVQSAADTAKLSTDKILPDRLNPAVSSTQTFLQSLLEYAQNSCGLFGLKLPDITIHEDNGPEVRLTGRAVDDASAESEGEGGPEPVDEHEDDEADETFEALSKRELGRTMRQQIQALLLLARGTLRFSALFHRRFLSDHRIVILDIDYNSIVCGPRVDRSASSGPAWIPLATAIQNAGFSRRGNASGAGANCFLYSLLQLVANNPAEDHDAVRSLRLALALRGTVPARGFLEITDPLLAAWFDTEYPAFTLRIFRRNTLTGALAAPHTLGKGGTVINMLLENGHFEPLWP